MEHTMVEMAGLYFVIANDARARFVRPGPDNHPHTIQVVDLATLRGNADGATPAREPPGQLEQAGFTRLLAERINDDFAVDLFSVLVLVASSHMLAELVAMLSGPTAACMIGTLTEDLVAVPDDALWPHLEPWLASEDSDGVPPDEAS